MRRSKAQRQQQQRLDRSEALGDVCPASVSLRMFRTLELAPQTALTQFTVKAYPYKVHCLKEEAAGKL